MAIYNVGGGGGGGGSSVSGDYLPLTGGTLTGALGISNGSLSVAKGSIWAGTDGDTTAERQLGVQSGAGKLYMYAQADTSSYRGLFVNAHGTGNAQSVIEVDPNNNIKYRGGQMLSSVSFTNASHHITRPGYSCSWWNGRDNALITQTTYTGYNPLLSMKTSDGSFEIGPYSDNFLYFAYVSDATHSAGSNTGAYSTAARISSTGGIYGAVWNDFAEFRNGENIPGKVMVENGDDTISVSIKRLQPGAMICSDTFGFAIGETDECQCPVAVAGRVLAYTMEPREEYKEHIGQAVCSGPDGKVSIMTKEEQKEYPECVIGYISAVPDYEVWGSGDVKVDGRVWIKVK